MIVPPWLWWSLFVAIAISMLVYVVYVLVRHNIEWKDLLVPGSINIKFYGHTDEITLAKAFNQAAAALCGVSGWGVYVYPMLSGMRIQVRPDNEWVDMYGRKVAGLADGVWIVVGKDLAALCHEMAHVCELGINGSTDYEHITWEQRGIYGAIRKYEQWLDGGRGP